MAITHGGTNANNSLDSLVFKPGYDSGMAPADVATIAGLIKDDLNPAHPMIPGSFSYNGQLFVPNRGIIKILPGDVVMVDAATGWPILVSKNAIANGPWHNA